MKIIAEPTEATLPTGNNNHRLDLTCYRHFVCVCCRLITIAMLLIITNKVSTRSIRSDCNNRSYSGSSSHSLSASFWCESLVVSSPRLARSNCRWRLLLLPDKFLISLCSLRCAYSARARTATSNAPLARPRFDSHC